MNASGAAQPLPEQVIRIGLDGRTLEGNLAIPMRARGVILFAHGSGSGRHSPRNRLVARHLQEGGFATLLIDLLSADEEAIDAATRHLRFDIPLLGERLTAALDWLTRGDTTRGLPVGLFGASTGAAAALLTASLRPGEVAAVVSRGGRADLAGPALRTVEAPTLLIVGEWDGPVIALNQHAMTALHGERRLVIVPRATHLFEEPGTLEQVADLARTWFTEHLTRPGLAAQSPSLPRDDAPTAH